MKLSCSLVSLGTFGLISLVQAAESQTKKPNILFICVDDLRKELGCYGNTIVQTPNLDKLAAEGSLFFNHYVQVPTSGASRASMLTGRLPRTRGDVSNNAFQHRITGKPEGKAPETMFHQLKRNGYYTVGIGKISHSVDGYHYGYEQPVSDHLELPYSWSEVAFNAGKWETGWNAFFGYADGSNRQGKKKQVKPYDCADVPDEGYPDGLTAQLAQTKLRELAQKDQPFCLAVGFFKPHLPLNAPKKYWDLYDEAKIPLTPVPAIPTDVNKASLHPSGEFNGYQLGDEKPSLAKPVSDAYARKLKHAYYACVSYTDAQIGKVLDELKRTGQYDNTIVVVWGDHGWHLGDLNVWGKHTLFETALGSTLIVKAPQTKKGVKNNRIVSSIDIYPTLMDLCGINTDYTLDGKSFTTLLQNPADKNWHEAAYGYFINGISLRTPEYRYTRYFREQQPTEELYDYVTDRFERENIIKKQPEVAKTLLPLWEKGNTGVYSTK